ncbi:MAG: energy transducer TonB [Terriglobales bacterium]
MFLDRLQCGFLLLETPHGMVPVELTRRQRIYLLWTFRHFRQLSLPLLNRRQLELIHTLARNSAGAELQSYDPELAVGVVENFVPAKRDSNASQEKITAALPAKRIETAKKSTASIKIQHRNERTEERAKLVQLSNADRDFALRAAKLGASKHVTPTLETPKASKTGLRLFGLRASTFATAAAVLCFCAGSVVVLEQMQMIPDFEAYSGPRFQQIKASALASLSKLTGPTAVAASAGAASQPASVTTPELVAQPITGTPSETDAANAPDVATSTVPTTEAAADSSGASSAAASPVTAPDAVPTPASAPPATVTPASAFAKPATADKPIASVEPAVRANAKPAATEVASAAPATTSTVVPSPRISKPANTSLQGATPAPKQLLTIQNHSSIQATRPPLHFVYPILADNSAKGVVAMTAQVDSAGSVRAVKVISGNRELADASVRAVRQWRYRPYLKDGQSIATETNIVISFFSSDAISMSYPPSIASTR